MRHAARGEAKDASADGEQGRGETTARYTGRAVVYTPTSMGRQRDATEGPPRPRRTPTTTQFPTPPASQPLSAPPTTPPKPARAKP
ncbi:hypothetical protein ALC53_09944 [Atta colombica]|uniref:Uncharacterized protein n=1 Tax=Atta colombica TaxID=520822 RepID=A0A195B569_9HYME|nr:hypothetical protein ALC53_09944 [Atta colombica]